MTWLPTLGNAEPYLNRYNETIYPDLNIWQTVWNYSPTIGIAILGLAIARSSVVALDKNEAAVLTGPLGKPKGVVDKPGSFKAPWPITKIRNKVSLKTRIEEDSLDTRTTGDNGIDINLAYGIEWRVTDAEKYTYHSENPKGVLRQKVSAAIRNEIGQKSFQNIIEDKKEIGEAVSKLIQDDMGEDYGIEVISIPVHEPIPAEEFRAQQRRQAAAEQELKAAGAEGQAKAKRIKAFVAELMASSKPANDEGKTSTSAEFDSKSFDEEALTMRAIDMFTTLEAADKGNVVISPTGTTPVIRPAKSAPANP